MDDLMRYDSSILKQFLSTLRIGAAIFDYESGKALYLNDEYFKIIGYSEKEYKEILSGDEIKLAFPNDKKIIEETKKSLIEKQKVENIKYRIISKDGEILSIEYNSFLVLVDEKVSVLCFFKDITKEKDLEKRLDILTSSVGSSLSILKIKNGNTQLVYANQTFFDLLGVTKEEYEKNSYKINKSHVSEEGFNKTENAIKESVKTGKVQEIEYEFITSDNKKLWMNRRLMVLKQDEKDAYLLCSAVTDTTKRKEAEDAAVLEAKKNRELMENMPTGFCKIVVGEDGTVRPLYMNSSFLKMTDMDYDTCMELYSKNSFAGVHPDDLDDMTEKVSKFEINGVYENYCRIQKGKNAYIWVDIISSVKQESIGKVIYNSYQDITKERENLLMFNGLLNGLPGGVAVFKVSAHLECEYFSDGFTKLFGRTREELEDLRKKEMLFEASTYSLDLPNCLEKIYKLSKEHKPINFSYRSVMKDGSIKWLTVSSDIIREEDGNPVYYCVFTAPPDETNLYRSIVDDSETCAAVLEVNTRRILLMNESMKAMYGIKKEFNPVGKIIFDVVLKENILLSANDVNDLNYDSFTEWKRTVFANKYYSIKAKKMDWNGVESYVVYASDITLEHNKHRFQEELLNSIPTGVAIYKLINNEIKQVYLSDGFYRMLKYDKKQHDEVIKGNFISGIYKDDIGNVKNMIDRLKSGVSSYDSAEFRNLCGDGSYMWVNVVSSLIKDKNGIPTAYCVYENIEENIKARERMKLANETIKEQYDREKTQRKILEKDCAAALHISLSKNLLIEYRSTTPVFYYFKNNSKLSDLVEDIMKRTPSDDDKNKIKDYFDLEKNLERYKNGMVENIVEYESRQNDGCLHIIKLTDRIILLPYTKEVQIWSYAQDVTNERKKAKISEFVIDNETDCILLFNSISKKVDIIRLLRNENFYNIEKDKSYDANDIIANKYLNLVMPQDKELVKKIFNLNLLVKELNEKGEIVVNYRTKNSKNEIRRKKTSIYYLDQNHEDIVIVRRDITDVYTEEIEQKRVLENALKEAQIANKTKTEFLSRMSHDIRTPMNAILNLTDLSISEIDDKEKLINDLDKIKVSGRFLLGLINDILDMSKIESGKMELNPSVYSFSSFKNYMESIADPLSKQYGVNFTWERFETYPSIYVDIVRFNQIFFNILSNALKYTPKGGNVVMTINNTNIENDIITSDFIIKDTGIGMSEEFLKKAFSPFERADSVSAYVGSGLGLSITREIVRMMNGTIKIESTLGKGTTVTITLPLPIAEEDQKEEKKEETIVDLSESLENNSKYRILIVEDYPLNREIIERILKKVGYNYESSQDGVEALSMYEKNEENYYSAILMDIRMPNMDGLTATERIRKMDRSDAKTIPIIALSANAFEEDKKMSLKAGMNAHLSKPINPKTLYKVLSELLNK